MFLALCLIIRADILLIPRHNNLQIQDTRFQFDDDLGPARPTPYLLGISRQSALQRRILRAMAARVTNT
jgi:hypothetical protein